MSGTSLTDTSGEKGMIKVMGMVIFSLLLLSLFIVSMARLLGSGREDGADDPLMRNALISRIEPVGAVRTSADELEQVADAGGATEVASRSGEELVQGVCAGCHMAGAAGAPMLGDEEAWAARREEGLDYLVASVINGKGSMPANGGSDYSEDEIRRAVQHIALFEETDEAGGDSDAAAAEAPVEASATTMTESAKDGEAAATEEVPSGGQVAPADDAVEGTAMAADANTTETAPGTEVPATDESTSMADNDMEEQSDTSAANDMAAGAEADGVVTTRDVATEEGAPGEVATDAIAEDVGTAEPGAEMPSDDLSAIIATGHEPEGLTDEIKAQVNGVCAGCHVAGVAGAPMLGDKEAWGARAELGLAALTDSVINGKGVMPARGGSTLTDEQVPIAIQYQMGKTGP